MKKETPSIIEVLDQMYEEGMAPGFTIPNDLTMWKYSKGTVGDVARRSKRTVAEVIEVLKTSKLSYANVVSLSENGRYSIEAFYWMNKQVMKPSLWIAMFYEQLRARIFDVTAKSSEVNEVVEDILKRAVAERDVYGILGFLVIRMYHSENLLPITTVINGPEKYYTLVNEYNSEATFKEMHSYIVHKLFTRLPLVREGELTACAVLLSTTEFKLTIDQENRIMEMDKEIAFEWADQVWKRQINPTIYRANREHYASERRGRRHVTAYSTFKDIYKYNRDNFKPHQIKFVFDKELLSFVKTFIISKLN